MINIKSNIDKIETRLQQLDDNQYIYDFELEKTLYLNYLNRTLQSLSNELSDLYINYKGRQIDYNSVLVFFLAKKVEDDPRVVFQKSEYWELINNERLNPEQMNNLSKIKKEQREAMRKEHFLKKTNLELLETLKSINDEINRNSDITLEIKESLTHYKSCRITSKKVKNKRIKKGLVNSELSQNDIDFLDNILCSHLEEKITENKIPKLEVPVNNIIQMDVECSIDRPKIENKEGKMLYNNQIVRDWILKYKKQTYAKFKNDLSNITSEENIMTCKLLMEKVGLIKNLDDVGKIITVLSELVIHVMR